MTETTLKQELKKTLSDIYKDLWPITIISLIIFFILPQIDTFFANAAYLVRGIHDDNPWNVFWLQHAWWTNIIWQFLIGLIVYALRKQPIIRYFVYAYPITITIGIFDNGSVLFTEMRLRELLFGLGGQSTTFVWFGRQVACLTASFLLVYFCNRYRKKKEP